MDTEKSIFQNGSTTYYFSSLFFPKSVKKDIFKLYSFVRVADDYVDSIPVRKKEFLVLRDMWNQAKNDTSFSTKINDDDAIQSRVIKNIIFVSRKYNFEQIWIESFFDSMQADIERKKYQSINDTIWYMYGSAEVIGLMMAKILQLPKQAYMYAQLQGRAMQYINFIRDIAEDNSLGRCYFPISERKKYKLTDLSEQTAQDNPKNFSAFIRSQINLYKQWQTEATKGYTYIPHRYRVPLETASEMYQWTAETIYIDPLVVYKEKIKPSKTRVIRRALKKSIQKA